MSILNNSNAIESGGYPISNSLRFQSASSQYLSRTPASAGNRKTWTWSAWVKRGDLANSQVLFSAYNNSSTSDADFFSIKFNTSGTLGCDTYSVDYRVSSAVYRDPSAWYHVVVTLDTTQATANNRIKMYVNGSEITSFTTTNNPTQNANSGINSTIQHRLGSVNLTAAPKYFDGYLTEINFIDGQALTPSSFGETNTLTGQWIAKRYTGTYGTNGFYLPFSNGTSTTTLGYDSSGNGNNWTLTNFTRSAGVSDCWMYDVPSGNGGASGTQPSSNYATLNPLAGVSATLSRANLYMTGGSAWGRAPSTILLPSTGKFYFEGTLIGNPKGTLLNDTYAVIGLLAPSAIASWVPISGGNSFWVGDSGHYINYSTSSSGSFTGNTSGTVLALAVDRDTNQVTIYQNNVSKATVTLGIAAGSDLYAFLSNYDGTYGAMNINFGQRSFAYTPPSGFKALCTANLPASTIVKGNQYMDATTYTGDGTSSKAITNAYGFNPDLVWIKNRSNPVSHVFVDAVRGTSNNLASDLTAAENSGGNAPATYGTVSALNSNGFTVAAGTDPTYKGTNGSGQTYVAWQWDAGSSTVTNTDGSISSQVRANPTAGVSVVTYTGTGANATVGHGLGVAPKMVIVKNRTSGTQEWAVYHANLTAPNYYLFLNTTAAQVSGSTVWSASAPTSSVFNIGTAGVTNLSANNYVAYCFAEIAGFSKFGSYTGNGSADGTFVYTGFRPKFILFKRTDVADDWMMFDSARNTYNVCNGLLRADLSNAELTTYNVIDFVSNGFKLRATNNGWNASGGTYIYMTFAENPFQNSNAR